MIPEVDMSELLEAAIGYRLPTLSTKTGISTPRLSQLALEAIRDDDVIAAHPRATRVLVSANLPVVSYSCLRSFLKLPRLLP